MLKVNRHDTIMRLLSENGSISDFGCLRDSRMATDTDYTKGFSGA